MDCELKEAPIGVFDSGYGGLTILHQMRSLLPQYDYIYLGDNARAPYGPRSFDVVYRFTLEAVRRLFSMGCRLVIIACNTASAKALRTIQQNDLPRIDPARRVLGVIRPTAECIGRLTLTRHVGVLATEGTIKSGSYGMEIAKLWPDIKVTGVACPLWVPLIENNEYDKILKHTPRGVRVIPQGEYVAESLKDYLRRHPEIEAACAKHGTCRYLTTENSDKFNDSARIFMHEPVHAETIFLADELSADKFSADE